jgi:hypothetical protein
MAPTTASEESPVACCLLPVACSIPHSRDRPVYAGCTFGVWTGAPTSQAVPPRPFDPKPS